MKPMSTAAVLAALACGLCGQDGGRGGKGPAAEIHAALVAEYQQAQDAYNAASRELRNSEEYKAAVAAKDQKALAAMRDKLPEVDREGLARRAWEAAAEFAGDDRVPLLCLAVEYAGKSDPGLAALGSLKDDHMRSPALIELLERGYLIGRTLGVDEGNAFLDLVAEESPHAAVRAFAYYWRGQGLRRSKDKDEQQQADEFFTQAAKLSAGTKYADKLGAPVFEREHLQIGMKAPDIEGVDTDGTPFKLSDYRGKVVVLDFWGFW